jgi:hypothetical protein
MCEYISAFIDAMSWTNDHSDKRLNYPLQIDQSKKFNMDDIAKCIADEFSILLPHSDVLPGRCFRVARRLSYLLIKLQIKHTVTIGDIKLDSGWYVSTSRKKIKNELKAGYQFSINDEGLPIGRPIDAHAWITLENGQILDATILPLYHRENKPAAKPLSFKDSIYYHGKDNTPTLKHIPLMTGFGYHAMVLMHPKDGYYKINVQWVKDYFNAIDKISS